MNNKYGIVLETKDFGKTPNEVDAVLEFVHNGVYDFVQFVVLPDTYADIHEIVKTKFHSIKTIIHTPFFMHGVNLSDADLLQSNLQKLSDAQKFADDLKSDVIILHPGIGDGKSFLDETIRQMKILNDPRIAVENLPYHPRPQYKMHGATPDQIKMIMEEVGCNFCFDIAHAICAVNSLQLDSKNTLKEFNDLKPIIYHLSDGDSNAIVDYHLHLGVGNYNLNEIFHYFSNSRIVLETRRKEHDLDKCVADVQTAKNVANASRELSGQYNHNQVG